MGWSRTRCCVAVPLYNVGVYAILAQYAVISLVTGVLSFAAPYIVAVSIPTGGAYVLAVVCLVVFGLQGWGFFGVYKEKPATYRRYVHVNAIVVGFAFLVALIWIILSAVRHSKAVEACVQQFVVDGGDSVSGDDSSLINLSSGTVSGQSLCNIFTWVQLGVMAGLWLALLLVQLYFTWVSRIYGTEQRSDHKRYNSIYTDARQSFIRQSQVWDASRASLDESDQPSAPPRFGHGRSGSTVSKSSALRNEVKLPLTDEDGDPNDYSRGSEGYADVPLGGGGGGAAPTKDGIETNAYARPVSGYSAYNQSFATTRSRLAPENSTPAYQNHDAYHQRNASAPLNSLPAGAQGQGQTHQRDSRYDDSPEDEFASYYMR